MPPAGKFRPQTASTEKNQSVRNNGTRKKHRNRSGLKAAVRPGRAIRSRTSHSPFTALFCFWVDRRNSISRFEHVVAGVSHWSRNFGGHGRARAFFTAQWRVALRFGFDRRVCVRREYCSRRCGRIAFSRLADFSFAPRIQKQFAARMEPGAAFFLLGHWAGLHRPDWIGFHFRLFLLPMAGRILNHNAQ